MSIVARHAAETTLARGKHGWLHLLHLPHELLPLAVSEPYRRKTRSGAAPGDNRRRLGLGADTPITERVALLADVSAEDGVEVPGVYDRQVPAARKLLCRREWSSPGP